MTAVFISHSSKDRVVATQVHQRLRDAGYTLFLDFHESDGIPGGSRWERELYLQLRKADAVVFLASKDSVIAPWCFAELAIARSQGRPIVPLRLDDEAKLALLQDVQWVNLEGEAAYAQLIAGLRREGLDPVDSFDWDPGRSPYPGLEPFEQGDAAVFFGRDGETKKLMELLQTTPQQLSGRFVAIIGPSGSGKSSLLRAGLLPRLARMPERWVVLPALLPGNDPTAALSHSLAQAFSAVLRQERSHQDLAEELRDGAPALVRLVRELGEARGLRRKVLMVIDQAEELVTRSGPAGQRAFLALLRDARYEGSPLWVVATVRSEFLSSAPDRAGLAEAINDTLLVGPLSRDRLPEVIERPARWAGLMFEGGLIGRMVEDTAGGDALPLLAWTLQQTG